MISKEDLTFEDQPKPPITPKKPLFNIRYLKAGQALEVYNDEKKQKETWFCLNLKWFCFQTSLVGKEYPMPLPRRAPYANCQMNKPFILLGTSWKGIYANCQMNKPIYHLKDKQLSLSQVNLWSCTQVIWYKGKIVKINKIENTIVTWGSQSSKSMHRSRNYKLQLPNITFADKLNKIKFAFQWWLSKGKDNIWLKV